MSKTNVLHIIDTLGIGGAEKVMIGCINSLPEFHHHVVYLGGSNALEDHLPVNCQILQLNYRSKFDIFRCALQLRRYIREKNIAIVHSHLFMATIIARIACPKKLKLFTTIHSLPSKNYFAESRIAKWIEKLTYRSYHHIIAICHEVFRDYNECIGVKGPYTILYNYVEDVYYAKRYHQSSFTDKFRMVAIGNLKKAKNYPYLIEAFKTMPKNIHLDIYGSGPLQQSLQQDIDQHQLNIRLCGVRDDIHNVLPQYDAFIMSSVFEGQPISLLEAMACGIPAILSDIPVLREVTNNKAIFYKLDNTKDLVEKIKAIADYRVDLNEYASSNFERVQRIASKDNYMHTLSKLYQAPELHRIKQPLVFSVKTLLPGIPAQA
ncbi:MAG TPA: glycosyltransferase [Chitinophagaceae bacterium]